MSDCTHDCNSCQQDCSGRITFEKPHELSRIGKVIGVVSGKGGVGKSLTACLFALEAVAEGKRVAILDADITGPSIPRALGIEGGAEGDDMGIYPRTDRNGIKVMSSNLLLERPNDPVVWRGPMIAGMVKQFWTDVIWGDVDVMFVDMPPGTGDVPLTVFQSIKLDGIVIVTSPQELVGMIVEKAVKMANTMNVKIYGVVENMSYLVCPDCGKQIDIFGSGKVDEVATDFDLKVLARIPMDGAIASAMDAGDIGRLRDKHYMQTAIKHILR